MPRRFSDIYRGGELKLALDNLNTYRANAATRTSPRITGQGTPTNRLRSIIAVAPFYMGPTAGGTPALKYVEVSCAKGALEDSDNFAKPTVDNYQKAASNANTPKPQGFTPARARAFHPTNQTAQYTKSKFTQLYYSKREGKGFSLPFGRKALNQDYETAITEIKAALSTEINTTPYRRLNFQEESIPGE